MTMDDLCTSRQIWTQNRTQMQRITDTDRLYSQQSKVASKRVTKKAGYRKLTRKLCCE